MMVEGLDGSVAAKRTLSLSWSGEDLIVYVTAWRTLFGHSVGIDGHHLISRDIAADEVRSGNFVKRGS
jgi:hypothetical protein